jgi:hypothetical protein
MDGGPRWKDRLGVDEFDLIRFTGRGRRSPPDCWKLRDADEELIGDDGLFFFLSPTASGHLGKAMVIDLFWVKISFVLVAAVKCGLGGKMETERQ